MVHRDSSSVYGNLLAGSCAGAVSRFCVAPLDLVKIRFQIQDTGSPYRGVWKSLVHITRTEGLLSLWKGNMPGMLMVTPYGAIQFVAYQQFNSIVDAPGPVKTLLTGAGAGAFASTAVYPLDLMRTRRAAMHYGSKLNFSYMIRVQGFSSLYQGLGATLIGIVPYAAIQFCVYDTLKRNWADSNDDTSQFSMFMAGLIGGVIAKVATMPLDVVKKRLQVDGLEWGCQAKKTLSKRAYSGFRDCFVKVFRNEGISAFYRGTSVAVLKTAPNSAIMFVVYEAVLNAYLNATE